jgi:hypothetical protein
MKIIIFLLSYFLSSFSFDHIKRTHLMKIYEKYLLFFGFIIKNDNYKYN